jgi:hypothetical protein
MSDDRRNIVAKRIAVDRDATLVTSDGHTLNVRLTEVSLDGFRIAHRGEDLVVGELVMISDGNQPSRRRSNGPLAKKLVLKSWNLRRTFDVGRRTYGLLPDNVGLKHPSSTLQESCARWRSAICS